MFKILCLDYLIDFILLGDNTVDVSPGDVH